VRAIVEKRLELTLTLPPAVDDWQALADKDYLARFLRTLDAGRRFAGAWRWSVEPLAEGGLFGWAATAQLGGRAYVVHLTTERAAETPPASSRWTLLVAAEPGPRGATLRDVRLRRLMGLVLGTLIYFRMRGPLGDTRAMLLAMALALLLFVLLPSFSATQQYPRNAGELHPLDGELLDAIRGGIENFAPFTLTSDDWQDVAV
jgi:hypothetical protein